MISSLIKSEGIMIKRFFGGVLKWVAIFFAGVALIGFVSAFFSGPPRQLNETEKAAAVEREKAEAAEKEVRRKQKEKDDAENAKRENNFQYVVLLAKALKDGIRDPDSLVWESISASEDVSVVCFTYRAKNGFGGMNREFAVVVKGKFSQSAGVWNKNCAHKTLIDMIRVKHAL